MGSLGEELRLGNPQISRRGGARASCHLRRAGTGLDYLARTITHNGRDLEAAINRLLAPQANSMPSR